MGIISFLVLGAIAGSIARAFLPGRIGGGLLSAIVCGVAGALVGGWLSARFFDIPLSRFWDIHTWIIAIAGSLIVLFVWGLLPGRNKHKK